MRRVALEFGDAALGEPGRHLAIRFLSEALEGEPEEHPGLRNKGLFATRELLYGVPKRDDWDDATARSRPLLSLRGQNLASLTVRIWENPNVYAAREDSLG